MIKSVRNILLCTGDGLCACSAISQENQEDEAAWHDRSPKRNQIPQSVRVRSLPMEWEVRPPHETESLCGLEYVPDDNDSLALSVEQEEPNDCPVWGDNNNDHEGADASDHDSTHPQVGVPEIDDASATLDPMRLVVWSSPTWKPLYQETPSEETHFDDGSSYSSFHHGIYEVRPEGMMPQLDTPHKLVYSGDTQSGFVSSSTESTSTTIALTLEESFDD